MTPTAPAAPAPFGDRLADVMASVGPLCVGIDPHPWLLDEWSLPVSAAGAREMGLRVVEATRGGAGIVKPQVAFYERWGSAGFAALEAVLAAARDAGLLVVGDAKRGDIGSTMDAYAEAWFSPDSPLRVDALTVSPYLGFGAAAGTIALARASGAGVFVLGATSNPEAQGVQRAGSAGADGRVVTVAGGIVDHVLDDNQTAGETRLGSVGLVLGATVDLAATGIDVARLTTTPVLAPGFGHQGARYDQLRSLYGPAADAVVVSTSRGVLSAGPSGVAAAVRRDQEEVRSCLA
ncbi:orotidine-5'-phosphate decarboxylase [Frigoribacterium sp. CFBP 8754]|uniref:orotidine-5'-phosphate decarboxylase n=1 Tax=unclassified Frigoribacterium TaxID=2627005 RepID=UPI0006F79D87|nr:MULTISPECIES: orotidine-5'-phosphate decarboxylase [unclassified Frigoribacterium]KQR46947.1 orotidine 5'-phosphate decarboxylase [Frigoribacterium sp. Leaf164]MBD8659520.1 orotidine-5'-phosphate decarboxylase [Frigoribacterium sp. CFBP 8754]